MNISIVHEYENELRKKIERTNSNHPILKYVFGSCWKAIEEYEKVLK